MVTIYHIRQLAPNIISHQYQHCLVRTHVTVVGLKRLNIINLAYPHLFVRVDTLVHLHLLLALLIQTL